MKMKIYGSLYADSYQSQPRPTIGNTKYNHGGGQAMLLTQDHEVRDRLIAYIEHKLDLTRPR